MDGDPLENHAKSYSARKYNQGSLGIIFLSINSSISIMLFFLGLSFVMFHVCVRQVAD